MSHSVSWYFMATDSVFDSIRQEQMVDSLRCELASIRTAPNTTADSANALSPEPAMVEQVARENYGMKKPMGMFIAS